MRSLIVVLFATLVLNLASGLARASCVDESLADRASRADVIAYGRLNADRFELRQILKGTANGVITVRLSPEKGAVTSVDYAAADGTDQTLYLRLVDGEYVTDACSGSHAGQPTSDERTFFGAGTGPEVWTMGGGALEDSSASSQNMGIAVAVLGLGAAALAALAIRRVRAMAS